MANPQKEDGYTPIANEILDHLYDRYLSPNQWQILMFIIRKTYGYGKKIDYITNSQIVELTGILKSNVSRALKSLISQNIIIRDGKNIGLQKDWEQWKKLSAQTSKVISIDNNNTGKKLSATQPKLSATQPELSAQTSKVITPIVTQKNTTIQKIIIQKKGDAAFLLPEWINQETWDAFLEVRARKKAVNSVHALNLVIKELVKFKTAGEDPMAILNKSIINSWKDVFSLKKDNPGNNGHKPIGTPGQKYEQVN